MTLDGARTGEDGGSDLALESLHARGFDLVLPQRQSVPFVFASPHSGRVYPKSFTATSRLSTLGLRRSEDAFVDELFASAVELGAPMIAARFPRAYLDANRAPGELDPAMFDGVLAVPVDPPGARVNAGLGVIPRIVRDGAEIYHAKLAVREAEERLSRLYRPYHTMLAKMLEETRARFGCAVLIDCHSMPSAAAIPDIVLGDRYGMSATHALMRRAEHDFEHCGFTVARNTPYAGGYSTHVYGRPMLGHHALQIEVNRALYLDEERIEQNTRFERVAGRIGQALRELTAIDPALLRPSGSRALAAE
ncbi:MAG: N-formylglutamate amidohydrolase [Proteobacteria bacterium]|nr:N-formylglutamate amidohydrolase [Pseudomonadota bacterium]